MNQENKQLPTAESILQLHLTENQLDETSVYVLRNAISAMGHYKDLHTDPLREELEKLRAENERLKKETEEWKLYGKSWSEKSASRLGEVISLDEQNQKLREALVRISNEEIASDEGYWDTLDRIRMIAKEALKG